ncbi:uncharacterized protein LOC134756064 [Cydia strobilella]|uniref:uncharacterized protein LOC134756064 n=1 Tax=Cydia strobilella TaxID=1100964 RepID=UPI003004F151
MNVLVTETGFRAITHEIIFQPETMNKGKNLVLAGHVVEVQDIRQGDRSYMIKARVVRQASVTATAYKTALILNTNRHVTSVTCDCVYNKSGKCKHIAALIYYINHEESSTKTSQEQRWGKPSVRQFTNEKYSKGRYFHEMYPTSKKHKCEAFQFGVSDFKEDCALKRVLEAAAKNCAEDIEISVSKVVQNLVEQTDINIQREDCVTCLENFNIFRKEFEVYKSDSSLVIEKTLKNFYETNVVLEDKDIFKLCSDTIEQSMCEEWYSARKLRISSSTNVHNIKVRKTKTVERLAQQILFPNPIDCSATQYGKNNEKYALEEYQILTTCRVIRLGVIVSKDQPWLCTSVDGVVVCDECVRMLVEVKCPISCKNQPIVDFDIKKCNVQYLEFVNDEPELKRSKLYYTQIQVQMYVTGMTICDLFIYSPKGSCIVRVDRDEDFIKAAILKSEEFYFAYYLPLLYSTRTSQSEKNQRSFTGKNIINTMLGN